MAKKNLSGSFGKDNNRKKKGLNSEQRKQMRADLGELISKYRIIRGYTQHELSQLCGHAYDIVSRWETGVKPNFTPEDAKTLIDVMKLPEDLFDEFSLIITPRKYNVGKYKDMGARLKVLLDERGMKQNELATALELYPQHINGFIAGTIEPKIYFIRMIVDIFFEQDRRQEGLNYLFYGERPPRMSYKKQLEIATQRIKYLEGEVEDCKKVKEGAA